MKSTQKKPEMYMANAKNLRLGPNATYNFSNDLRWVFVLGDAKNLRKDTNMLVYFALGNAKVPNANGFVSQWNIGFSAIDIRHSCF